MSALSPGPSWSTPPAGPSHDARRHLLQASSYRGRTRVMAEARPNMAKVLLVGATGYLGFYVAEQLAAAGVQSAALVRDPEGGTDARKRKLSQLRLWGVELLTGSLDVELAQLTEILKGFNTVISLLKGEEETVAAELKLVEASQQSGTITRFFPAWWGGEYVLEGEGANPLMTPGLNFKLAPKKRIIETLKNSGVAYTIVVTYAFYGWSLPQMGNLARPGSPLMLPIKIYGDGNTRGRASAEQDIGRVVAQAVNDPRTANTRLVIHAAAPTQRELVCMYEAVHGTTVPCITVTNQEVEEELKGAQGGRAWTLSILKSYWLDNAAAIPPEQLGPEPVAYAHELYPTMKFMTVEEFYECRQREAE